MLPLSLLRTAVNHPMLVELKNGETYNGHLVSCDNWMNINLREVICTSRDGDRFWRMPECYIRGSTIKYLRIPDEVIDMVKEEVIQKSKGRGEMRGRGGPQRGGRGGRGAFGSRGGGRGGGRGGQQRPGKGTVTHWCHSNGEKTSRVAEKARNFQPHAGRSKSVIPEERECDIANKNPSNLNSFLWTLKRDPPSYFFGTIHVPYTRVWNFIPENTKVAFEESEDIVFELDLTNPYTISALANCQLLPSGKTLDSILPEDIYVRLKDHIQYVKSMLPSWMTADQKGMGLYADYLFDIIAGNWERKRPIWVMLMVNSLTENDIKSRGIPVLDLYLAQEAEKMGKVTGAVERVEEQCVPLNELDFSQVLFALNQTLWQHEVSRSRKNAVHYTTDDLIHHYNCGDLNSIIFNHDTAQVPNLVNSSLPPQDLQTAKMIDEYFRDELINKRNERMTDRVINLLKAHPQKSFFFAFGAGHFLGNETVIDRLKKQGYSIEHIQHDDSIPRSKGKKRRKLRRKKKERKHYFQSVENIWLPMDPSRRPWMDQLNKKTRKQARARETPFNDLWIRIDNKNPGLMTELAERFRQSSNQTQTQTQKSRVYYQQEAKSLSHIIHSDLILYIVMVTILLFS
uniref:Metalloprotease TIKI homolog n=2 Tax=Magallana gigas TaxID=29159 RepID=A0A8W8LJY3_MAGGI